MQNAGSVGFELSREDARAIMLAAQGLERLPERPATKADVLEAIRTMGVLQIDTINVVARSPYLVLWSRLGDYRCEWLDELLADGALFEYWAHAMCFVPVEDFPFCRRMMLELMQERKWPVGWAVKWAAEHPETMERVRAHLRENGTVRSAELKSGARSPGGWWNWKDEKNALEALFLTGEAMIAERRNFQRVYALRERVLRDWEDARAPSQEETRRAFTLRSVHSLGVAAGSWVPDYYRQPKTGMPQRLEALAGEGLLVRGRIEGVKGPAYLHRDRLPLLEEVSAGRRKPVLTTLLSPFDPLVWDRQRAHELFDFDYKIECYTPAPKRRYGYFTLPILHRGRLVGRLDPKAHRSRGVFEVKALHWEAGVVSRGGGVDDELKDGLAAALHRCASWHGLKEILISA